MVNTIQELTNHDIIGFISVEFVYLRDCKNNVFNFVQNLEYYQMSLLGLNDKECDRFVSQIKYDKKKIYDPNLLVKVPFVYNKFNADIYSDNYSGVNIFNNSTYVL